MYAKNTRPSAKREVQKERTAKRDDQIARPRRAQTCARDENVPVKQAGFVVLLRGDRACIYARCLGLGCSNTH